MNGNRAEGGIFINYRQRDSNNGLRNHAILVEALARRLTRHFGENMVFVDTSMSSGTRYPDELRTALTACHVLLAVIHPEWLEDLHQRQDSQGPDWVLDEISIALTGRQQMRNSTTQHPAVIPILLERAELPEADELPEKIRKMANLKTFRFHSGALASDVARLIEELEDHIPASWQPNPETKPKKSVSPSIWIVITTITELGLQAIGIEPIAILITLIYIGLGMIIIIFLSAAIMWMLEQKMYQAEGQVISAPIAPRKRSIVGICIVVGTIQVPFCLITAQHFVGEGGSFQSAADLFFIILVGFLILALVVMAGLAKVIREDSEWPPRIPTQHAWNRTVSLRGAVALLEQRLTSSWRPPLSRVQRDQAWHIIRQLRKAVRTLQKDIQRCRWDWLRAEHRQAATSYAILPTGTVSLAIAFLFILLDLGHFGRLLYLAILTIVLAPAISLGTMELWFRCERKRNTWLAVEIEENIEKMLLPHLPGLPRPQENTMTRPEGSLHESAPHAPRLAGQAPQPAPGQHQRRHSPGADAGSLPVLPSHTTLPSHTAYDATHAHWDVG